MSKLKPRHERAGLRPHVKLVSRTGLELGASAPQFRLVQSSLAVFSHGRGSPRGLQPPALVAEGTKSVCFLQPPKACPPGLPASPSYHDLLLCLQKGGRLCMKSSSCETTWSCCGSLFNGRVAWIPRRASYARLSPPYPATVQRTESNLPSPQAHKWWGNHRGFPAGKAQLWVGAFPLSF